MWLISLFYFIVVSELEVSWNQQKTANSWNIFCWLFAIKFDLKQKKKKSKFYTLILVARLTTPKR